MLEATLSSGMGSNQTYPDSGPGPKTLKYGNKDLGYFGEVPQSEMFTLDELRREVNFWGGSNYSPASAWIKMFLSEKVIYFPAVGLLSAVSWDALYAAGLIYGVDGNGDVPGSPAVNQLVYATKGTHHFKVRCFKSHESNPSVINGNETIATSTTLKAGEWGRVISALISPKQTGYTGDNWGLYTGIVGNTGTPMVVQNLRQSNTGYSVVATDLQARLGVRGTAGYLWMPVLELTSPGEVIYFPIKDPIAASKGKALPVLTDEPSYEDSLIAYRLVNAGVQMGREINTGDVEYVDPYYRIDTSTVKMTNTQGLPLVINNVTYE